MYKENSAGNIFFFAKSPDAPNTQMDVIESLRIFDRGSNEEIFDVILEFTLVDLNVSTLRCSSFLLTMFANEKEGWFRRVLNLCRRTLVGDERVV